MSAVTPQQVKGLFWHLVRKVGGVEAAGAYLEVSAQRVSQLQLVKGDDFAANMPTVMQITILEQVAGEPIVTAALARAVGGDPTGGPLHETLDAVEAVAGLLGQVRCGKDRKAQMQAAVAAKAELEDVIASLTLAGASG